MSESRTRTTRRRFTVDSLFIDTSARGVGVSDLPEARLVRVDRIEPDPSQPRRSFDAERLDELAASILVEGILQPIAVRYDEPRDVYVIIHGERRWRAAQMAGLASLPAIVREVSEDRRLVQQLMENVLREDLNALDRAAALRTLKEQMGNPSWERVAEAVGIRRSRLFQLLDTEKLEESIQEAIRRGLVSEKQTRALHRLFPDIQAEIGERVLAGDLPARDLSEAARLTAELDDLESARRALDGIPRSPARAAGGDTRTPSAARAAGRQAVALGKSLATLSAGRASDLDSNERVQLVESLHELRDRIDETLEALEAD